MKQFVCVCLSVIIRPLISGFPDMMCVILKSQSVNGQLSVEVKSICASCRWHHTKMTPGSDRHRKQPFKSHQKSQVTCTNSRMLCQHKCTVKVKVGWGEIMPLVRLVTDAHGPDFGPWCS